MWTWCSRLFQYMGFVLFCWLFVVLVSTLQIFSLKSFLWNWITVKPSEAHPLSLISFFMPSDVLRTHEWTLKANTSYIQHLSTRWREISKLSSVWTMILPVTMSGVKSFVDLLLQTHSGKLSITKIVFIKLTSKLIHTIFNLGFVSWTRICWKCDLVLGTNTINYYFLALTLKQNIPYFSH